MALITIVALLTLGCVQGQFFEDRRCRCVCPNPASILNTTITRQIYTGNVPPSQCHCEGVVYPLLKKELEGKIQAFCPRCDCIYQTRNTTLIMPRRWICKLVPDDAHPVHQQQQGFILMPDDDANSNTPSSDDDNILGTRFVSAIVFLILIGLGVSILYMASFTWLKCLIFRGFGRIINPFRQADRHLERPPERDYIREHRGEYERERMRQRARELEAERQLEIQRERDRNRNRLNLDDEHENLLDYSDPEN